MGTCTTRDAQEEEAQEIERLREENTRLRRESQWLREQDGALLEQIANLREDIQNLRGYISEADEFFLYERMGTVGDLRDTRERYNVLHILSPLPSEHEDEDDDEESTTAAGTTTITESEAPAAAEAPPVNEAPDQGQQVNEIFATQAENEFNATTVQHMANEVQRMIDDDEHH